MWREWCAGEEGKEGKLWEEEGEKQLEKERCSKEGMEEEVWWGRR